MKKVFIKKALKISMKVLMSAGLSVAAIGLTKMWQDFIVDSIVGEDEVEN